VSAEGIFHDAHEVYMIDGDGEQWIATFATKAYAEGYVQWSLEYLAKFGLAPEADQRMELRPV